MTIPFVKQLSTLRSHDHLNLDDLRALTAAIATTVVTPFTIICGNVVLRDRMVELIKSSWGVRPRVRTVKVKPANFENSDRIMKNNQVMELDLYEG